LLAVRRKLPASHSGGFFPKLLRFRHRGALTLATYRLNFRQSFYDDADMKKQLPLPPDEALGISLVPAASGGTAYRSLVEGHDYVLVDYLVDGMVVTDEASPGMSEPALADIGGVWDEPFIFPVDPELLVQRTGYACMDEAEFPPNSVDSEDVEFFYDQECDVEDELTTTGCHYTKLPDSSCQDALTASVGSVDTPLHFERIAWDAAKADAARVGRSTIGEPPRSASAKAQLQPESVERASPSASPAMIVPRSNKPRVGSCTPV
jgi:hypothetical protein